jgi:hypothetical protein
MFMSGFLAPSCSRPIHLEMSASKTPKDLLLPISIQSYLLLCPRGDLTFCSHGVISCISISTKNKQFARRTEFGMDAQRQLLAELMNPLIPQNKKDYKDADVCKNYLASFCPNDHFLNTKAIT